MLHIRDVHDSDRPEGAESWYKIIRQRHFSTIETREGLRIQNPLWIDHREQSRGSKISHSATQTRSNKCPSLLKDRARFKTIQKCWAVAGLRRIQRTTEDESMCRTHSVNTTDTTKGDHELCLSVSLWCVSPRHSSVIYPKHEKKSIGCYTSVMSTTAIGQREQSRGTKPPHSAT